MWKKLNLDERQLKLRGDIFRHGFIMLLGLNLFDAFLIDRGINWADGAWRNIIIVMLPVTVCLIEKITRGIFSGKKRFEVLACFFGAISLTSAVFIAVNAAGGESFASGGTLTEFGVYIILNAMFFLVFVSFVTAKIRERRESAEE